MTRTTMRKREQALAKLDPVMAKLIAASGPCTMEPRLERSPFESLARAIAHQQLHGMAAESILKRFAALFAPATFPEPVALATATDESLRASGFSFSKIRALRDLADKVIMGVVPSTDELHTLDDETIIERITQVCGIGRWTVEMLLIFQLGRPDVLPVDDFGVCNGFRLAYGLKGMPMPKALAEFGNRWSPHRSLAAWYLWRAVDLEKDKKLPRAGRAPRIELKKKRPISVNTKLAKSSKPSTKRKVTTKKRARAK